MKLFLASEHLGNFGNRLSDLVGENRTALIISNARDYYLDEDRINAQVALTISDLNDINITAERLDLRKYFGKPDELRQFIAESNPGLIYSIGGNVFCLATALKESGMDEIIRQGVQNDTFVYAGYSAGSMITAHDLSLYDVGTNLGPARVYDAYGVEAYTSGLGLIPEYIAPHMDREDHLPTMRARIAQIEQAGQTPILLNDPDVYLVDDDLKEVL